jgi:hypothetical protein
MRKKLFFALFVLVALFALAFTVSNFVPLAQADIDIYGTVTYSPGSHGHPLNQFFHLYGDYFCLNDPANCSVVTVY